MTYRKKLIEVALPLEEINAASAREKSIRHGHPSTLHLWWARRPLATCRAVLFSSIIDDPGEEGVPQGLLDEIDKLHLARKYQHLADEEPLDEEGNPLSGEDSEREKTARGRRYRLFTFIERLVQWENSNDPETLEIARNLIREACRKPAPPMLIDYFEILKWAFDQVGDSNRGYERWGDVETLADLNRTCHEEFHAGKPFSLPIEKLRGVLFFNQRAHRMTDMGGEPTSEEVAYLRALFDTIRGRWDEAEPDLPPVLDPFCGGGSIPLEAQRLGLEAHASDLNPVAVLISKALIEIPPKFADQPPVNSERRLGTATWKGAQGLAEDVRYYGLWMRNEAERRIGHLYPKVQVSAEIAADRPELKPLVGHELPVIAWLWARTVPSPDPAALGVHAPLVRSFVLSSKKGKEAWIEPVVDTRTVSINFKVHMRDSSVAFTPQPGTIGKQGGTCLLTNSPMSLDHIRSCGRAGKLRQQMIAIVAEGRRGRIYFPPDGDERGQVHELSATDVPTAALPEKALGFRVQGYGMSHYADLYTQRQLLMLSTLVSLVRQAGDRATTDAVGAGLDNVRAAEYGRAVATYLAMAVSRVAMTGNSLVRWNPVGEKAQHAFGRQALSMTWDFAEPNPFGTATGSISAAIELVADPLALLAHGFGQVQQQDAVAINAPGFMFSTDPPYFDNIGYADLSDFFYVWLRIALRDQYPELLSTLLTPKASELIATPFRHDGSMERATAFFESGLRQVFDRLREQSNPGFPTTVYYAFKQSETDEIQDELGATETASTGWETMLQGLLDAGFTLNGTWPTRTEMATRMRSQNSNALASCIVLVCRPRAKDARTVTRREFLSILRQELKPALANLTQGNVAPVDLAQAAIGPGMAVFSRYTAVLEADGKPMRVRTALGLINQALEETLTEQEGWYDPQTRWAVTWFRQRGFAEGPYGDAEILATAKSAPVGTMVEAGIVKSGGGKVKLLSREELPADYDPANDRRTTIWEATQYLARALDGGGEKGAARLMRRFRETKPDLEVERARELAYRLYAICDGKRQAQEARIYNALVMSWTDIETVSQTDEALWQTTGGETSLFSEDRP